METRLAECQRVIGYHFTNPNLLEIALTHSSLRTPDRECNERLEFLGDSVLGLVITEELYRLLPDQAEGELTRIKSAVVSRGALYRASTSLGLARFAEFARGVGRRNELPVSVIANLVESVIGAIYLDAGYFPSREFVLRHLGPVLDDTLNDRGAKNYKSLLQHEVQQASGDTPVYRTVDEGGPDHRKQFTVAAVIRNQEWGRASGATKKEAEQEAARRALEAWKRRGRGRRRRRKPGNGQAESRVAAPAAVPARGRRGRGARREREEEAATPTGTEARSGRRTRSRKTASPAPSDAEGAAAPARKPRRRKRVEAEPAAELPSNDNGEVSADDAAAPEGRRRRRRGRRSAAETPVEAPAPAPEPPAPPSRERKRAVARDDEAPRARSKQASPEAAPASEGFAEGIEVDEAASGAAKKPAAPAGAEPMRRVPARRKARIAKPPQDDEGGGGFGEGL
ncbi:MAG: ribonuclease III [Planctomycetota bacterium]|jgi:ribonuclease-3